jgi:hypothetical protein
MDELDTPRCRGAPEARLRGAGTPQDLGSAGQGPGWRPLGGGADSPPPIEGGLRGAVSPQQGQCYDAIYRQR